MKVALKPPLAKSKYIGRETLVSALINGAISAGFFVLSFGGIDPILLAGFGNYAFDFIPQSLAIGIMATLVPGLLARKAAASGRIAGTTSDLAGVRLARRIAGNGILAILIGAALGAAMLLSGASTIASGTGLAIKVAYGMLLGAAATWLTLRKLLA